MINHPNRSKKTITLRALIAETYADDDAKFFGFITRSRPGFAPGGTVMPYDAEADRLYGHVKLTSCMPIVADDGSKTEFVYKSRWIDAGNGTQFRVLF